MNTFILIAHRGFSSQAPENTIAAFDLAVESGFTNIELDAQLTSDGEVVIFHDDLVDRTTNGTGLVSSFSLKKLQALDAGSWFSAKFSGERIPTLAAALRKYAGKAHLHLELKSKEPALVSNVAGLVKEYGWLSDSQKDSFVVPGVTITSASVEQLERSRKLLPQIPHHWLCWDLSEQIVEAALAKGFTGLCISSTAADMRLIEIAKQKGLTVRGLDVRCDDDVRRLIEAKAEGTTTNWPDKGDVIKGSLGV